MKMEFIFDESKLKKEKYTKEDFLEAIRQHFKKYDKDNSIKETSPGFFEGTDEQDEFDAFSTSVCFRNTPEFVRVIKEWYWYYDEGMGEVKDDCLKTWVKKAKS